MTSLWKCMKLEEVAVKGLWYGPSCVWMREDMIAFRLGSLSIHFASSHGRVKYIARKISWSYFMLKCYHIIFYEILVDEKCLLYLCNIKKYLQSVHGLHTVQWNSQWKVTPIYLVDRAFPSRTNHRDDGNSKLFLGWKMEFVTKGIRMNVQIPSSIEITESQAKWGELGKKTTTTTEKSCLPVGWHSQSLWRRK